MNRYLENLKKQARENFVPIIRDESGLFLQEKIRQFSPKRVLEIGTAIGYSGSLVLSACDCHLTTVEKDKALFDRACQTFDDLGFKDRTTAICADAKDVLNDLVEKKEKFDFIFLDGPKGQYINYLPKIKVLLSPGGVLFADNVNHDGIVLTDIRPEHKNRTMIVNLRKFLQQVQSDPDFSTQFFDIEDGILLAERNNRSEE